MVEHAIIETGSEREAVNLKKLVHGKGSGQQNNQHH